MIDYPALARELVEDGGFTVDLDGARPTSGYVVSTRPDATVTLRPRTVADIGHAIYVYVVNNGAELHGPMDYSLGAWLDGNTLVLDLVRVVDTLAEALELGALFDQDAVYDVTNAQVIEVIAR